MRNIQTYLAGGLVLLSAVMLSGLVFFAFVFPRTTLAWAQEGRALSATEQSFVNLSELSMSSGQQIILPLLLVFIGSVYWAIRTRSGQGIAIEVAAAHDSNDSKSKI
ncbi:hypothetical protein CA54_49610 [Symmachiella macrocystis]|uniref:Uncharacterized protein n=1 Tax=Symmachiella macrocystis TaxID=2527985 RepID=A0A5C6BEL1_9PLAN|nr:hypothetical protein [Symmachiella macrocystis]TWU09719.1 hypothetical protein CA54_49610 [Symmachiella macrocystis]